MAAARASSRITAIPEGPLKTTLFSLFTNQFRHGYILAENTVLPDYFVKFADRIQNFHVRENDVWVASFPKTGTTWTQEMVWCIANDLDFEGAKRPLQVRFPFLDHTTLFDYEEFLASRSEDVFPPHVMDSIGFLDQMPSTRFIKTHFPWQLLPTQIQERKPKIVYVARNAKDSCVSYYHHCRLMEGYRGSFQEFSELFLNDMLCFAPFWSHLLSFWNRRHEPNILFLKYEDMKKDLPKVIEKTSSFLGKTYTPEQIATLADHLSFTSMKNNPAVNYEDVVDINRKYKLIDEEEIASGSFMRQGQVGDWKAKMSPELIARFDEWTEKNLAGTGLSFV